MNDAPALSQADVGIALGTGTDAAIESIVMTLVKGDRQGIAKAEYSGCKAMRNIWENFFFALGYHMRFLHNK